MQTKPTLAQQEDHLFKVLSSERFLRMEGLGNEVAHFIYDYDPSWALDVAQAKKRATWRRWNLTAEAARQTMGYRFASTRDREAVIGMVVDAAEAESFRLTPPELASSPAVFR